MAINTTETGETPVSTEHTSDTTTPQVETTSRASETDETSATDSNASSSSQDQQQSQASLDDLQRQIKRMESALKKANEEAKNHRLENNDLKKFKTQVEQEKMTEQERQQAATKALENRLAEQQRAYEDALRMNQEIRVEHSVAVSAGQLGFADPSDGMRFIDRAAIDYDDNGVPTNIKDLLQDVLKSKPYLKAQMNGRPTPTSGGATNPPRSQTNGTLKENLTWEDVAQYTTNKAAFDKLPMTEQKRISAWIANPANRRLMR